MLRSKMICRGLISKIAPMRSFTNSIILLSEAANGGNNKDFHSVADSLLEYIEDNLASLDNQVDDFDISNSMGVLKIELGKNGTYVLNKQSPNKQIWWSSPVSGPKRFEWRGGDPKKWVNTRDGVELLHLLNEEIKTIFNNDPTLPTL